MTTYGSYETTLHQMTDQKELALKSNSKIELELKIQKMVRH